MKWSGYFHSKAIPNRIHPSCMIPSVLFFSCLNIWSRPVFWHAFSRRETHAPVVSSHANVVKQPSEMAVHSVSKLIHYSQDRNVLPICQALNAFHPRRACVPVECAPTHPSKVERWPHCPLPRRARWRGSSASHRDRSWRETSCPSYSPTMGWIGPN